VSALAPTVQAFFTERLITQRNASPHTIAPTATPSGCYSASPKTRPANSRFSWTSTIWTRR
jgi:hypothetical protein